MIKRILILGDSYTFGHGCSDRIYYYDHNLKKFIGNPEPFYNVIPSEFGWPSLLQKQFPEIEVINLAKPGHSNPSIFRDLLEFYQENKKTTEDLVIFNATFASRIEVASYHTPEKPVSWPMGWDFDVNKDEWWETNLDFAGKYSKAKKFYLTYLFNKSIGYNISLASIMGAYGFVKSNNIKFIWNYPISDYPYNLAKSLKSMKDCQCYHILKYDFEKNINHDNNVIEDSEFNKNCYAADYHVNDLGHKIYFEKEILPKVQLLL